MQQWEYLEVTLDAGKKSWKDSSGRSRKLKKGQAAATLAEVGLEGWELAGALPLGTSGDARLFFKRPLSEEDVDEAAPPGMDATPG
jgi:hypothetical protein